MVNFLNFEEIALAFEETTTQPHFDKIAFRVDKKIFATYDAKMNRVNIKLAEVDQSVFCGFDPTIIYPVPNKWGIKGWTTIDLNLVKEEMLKDALTTAYRNVAPKRLSEKYL